MDDGESEAEEPAPPVAAEEDPPQTPEEESSPAPAEPDGGPPLIRATLRGFLELERRDVLIVVALVLVSFGLRWASPIFPDWLSHPFSGAPATAQGIGHPYYALECSPSTEGQPLTTNEGVPLSAAATDNSRVCGFVFDEIYFPVDAAKDLHNPPQSYFDPEPPLAKLLMAPPIAAAGFNTWTWRTSTAIFGSLLIGLMYLIALRLRRDRFFALCAAFFLGFDGLAFVESRTGVIDIIAIFFVALFYYAFLLHWQARTATQFRVTLYVLALVAGLAFGAKLTALAPVVVAFTLIALRGLAPWIAAMIPRLRRIAGPRRHETILWRRAAGRLAVVHYVIALVIAGSVFTATWSRYMAIDHTDVYRFTACDPGPGGGLTGTGQTLDKPTSIFGVISNIQQKTSADLQYHNMECHSHPYASKWLSWPIMYHPVLFYLDTSPDPQVPAEDDVSTITDMGNPAVWWLGIPALLFCLWRALRGPLPWRVSVTALGLSALIIMMATFQASGLPNTVNARTGHATLLGFSAGFSAGPLFDVGFVLMVAFCALIALSAVVSRTFVPAFIVLGYLTAWMMWVPGNEQRVLFFYHALGMLIFTVLALAYACTALRSARIPGLPRVSLAPLAWSVPLLVLAAFIFFYPVWTAMSLPNSDHVMRLWVDAW